MKLSEKGKSRIHEMIDCAFEAHPDDAKGVQVLAKKYLIECDDFELQYDDFQNVVCLTVDEAKGILWDLRDLYKQTYGREWVKDEPWFDEFKKQINKAEIKHLKREIAQWKEEQKRDNFYLQLFLENVKQLEEEKQCKLIGKILI